MDQSRSSADGTAPFATTRKELFPDATINGPLSVMMPTQGINARAWASAIVFMVLLAIALLFTGIVAAQFGGRDTVNAVFGGPGHVDPATNTYDGSPPDSRHPDSPWPFAGTVADPLMAGAAAAAFLTFLLMRFAANGGLRRKPRQAWETWAAERGFQAASTDGLASWTMFTEGAARTWRGPYRGRVNGAELLVGATKWTVGHGRSRSTYRVFFASVELPDGIGQVFPGCSMTRILRGIDGAELSNCNWDELHLESTELNNDCRVRVRGDVQDVRWCELFDPVMVDGLATMYDVQWQQKGSRIVFAAGGTRQSKAPVATIDSLCLGAAFVISRYVLAAKGDMSKHSTTTDQGAPARVQDLQMTPEQLLVELRRYTTREEADRVERQLHDGALPVGYLDDLVFYLREAQQQRSA